jgi:hypothetical protein
MALPPLEAGAAQEIVACPLAAVADTLVGAPGTVNGVTALEAAEVGPLPAALAAVTVNVYDVPAVRPVTVAVVAGAATVTLAPAGLEMMA